MKRKSNFMITLYFNRGDRDYHIEAIESRDEIKIIMMMKLLRVRQR